MSETLVEAVSEPREDGQNFEEIARALIAYSAQASALADGVQSLGRVSDWHAVLEQVSVFAASLKSMQGHLATLTLAGSSRQRNPQLVDTAHPEAEECFAVNRDVSDDLEEPEQEHESEDEEPPIVAVRWALLSLGLLNQASDESSETEPGEVVAQDLQTSAMVDAAPKLMPESLASVAEEDQTDHTLQAQPSSPPLAGRAQDSSRKPELLLLIAGLLKKKRETLLLRSSMSPEAQRRLREVEEDIARVEKELSLRGAATYNAIVSSPATPTPTISTNKAKEHHLSIPEAWASSPPSAGSTTTPASNAPLTTTPSPVQGTLARPRTWDDPDEDCKEVQDSPKLNEAVKGSFTPGIDSGDAVLMASARSGAALLEHCTELQHLEADPPIADKENLRCCPNAFFQVPSVNIITPRETYTKASPMPSPSPAFERRAASTPGRRAASSFGSSGLFRETPSPRIILQQRSPATTPVPPPLPQPRSLFGSVSPPRYRNNAQLLEDWTNATATLLQGTSAAGPSPSKPVPAWPAFDSNSPVKALPRASAIAMVNRSPSAPVLGEKSRKAAEGDVKFRRTSNISGRLLDDTPSNLTDFRKSLELATRQKDDRPCSRSRLKKAAPWR